jgi:hypothetical protein
MTLKWEGQEIYEGFEEKEIRKCPIGRQRKR